MTLIYHRLVSRPTRRMSNNSYGRTVGISFLPAGLNGCPGDRRAGMAPNRSDARSDLFFDGMPGYRPPDQFSMGGNPARSGNALGDLETANLSLPTRDRHRSPDDSETRAFHSGRRLDSPRRSQFQGPLQPVRLAFHFPAIHTRVERAIRSSLRVSGLERGMLKPGNLRISRRKNQVLPAPPEHR